MNIVNPHSLMIQNDPKIFFCNLLKGCPVYHIFRDYLFFLYIVITNNIKSYLQRCQIPKAF